MANKTIELNRSASSGSYIIGKIVCDATADYSLNNSDVTCRIYVHKGNDSTLLTIPTGGTWTYSMTINGKVFSGTVSKDVLLDWVLLATVSVSDIAHNDDGTKSIAISGSITAPSGTNFSGHKTSGSGTFTLDTVPRASTIASAGNVTLGNACNVKWTPASASFRYKLKFTMGNWSYTTGAIHPNQKSLYTYDDYAIPLVAASQIPNSKTGTMTVTLYTYSDAAATKQVGSTGSKTFTVTVPDNDSTRPAVSMTLAPVSSLPSAFDGLYIQGKSKVIATLSAGGQYEATIKSYSMKVDGISHGSNDGYTSDFLSTYGTKTVYGYAIDSRGITGSIFKNITVIAYSKPKITVSICGRCDASGNLTDNGTYLKIKATRSYSTVISGGAQKNFCLIRYRYKAASATSYSAWTTILARDNLATNQVETGALLGGVLAVDTSYLVQVQAIDDIGEYADTTFSISTDKVYMHRTKNSIGLGKYSERENAVDSAWDVYMNDHTLTGLPMPVNDSDAVPKAYAAPADVKMSKRLNAQGWYKLGTISGDMCAVVTVTIGGTFIYNPVSPSMVDIATHYDRARAFLKMPASMDNQLSKIGVIKESATVFGVYGYYNSASENSVKINIHTHMGSFAQADWSASAVSESDMVLVIPLKE